ncbi:Scr1 family TA system antitoxin-like transcriptional regulator [Nocardiopsis metallicus]|uniref:Transcriptional regulator with XRE-family HTH domain n=1 Tax=Nocardiopsis metallicus TaxID=179819 RepID=A0A840WCP1_9ACTN|nr:Scr1 family TA system antitoxin-like transcriptional regulator [Nocardiopsis metallicus]MBB5494769.1 transcriptional regulator with XRE-family HTH domain [Nocardiopsis metallicus]
MSAQADLDQALAGLHQHSTPKELGTVYEHGATLRQLAGATKRSNTWVLRKLREARTPMRPPGRPVHGRPPSTGQNQGDSATSSTVQRHVLSRRLVELRTHANLTQNQAARGIGVSLWKMVRAERPQGPRSLALLHELCTFYDTPPHVREDLARLWREGHVPEWWTAQGLRVPDDRQTALGLRADARHVYGWSDTLVPELAQTAAYARVIEASRGDEEPVDMAVAVLMAAQRRVRRRGIDQRYVLDEAVIRRGVGGAQVMADQLKGLRQMAVRGRLRVLAWDSGHIPPINGFELCFIPELGTALYKPHTQKISVPDPSDTPSLDSFRTTLTHLWEHAADATATTNLIDHARAQLLGAQAPDVHTTAS